MAEKLIVIAVDPGVSGGIAILDGCKQPKIYKIPLEQIIVNKKKKNIYDLDGISKILEEYRGRSVLFVQELVSAMPGNGNVSMFNFGWSAGATLGIAAALGFQRYEVRPAEWKKNFPELTIPLIVQLKEDVKKLRLEAKTLKDKEEKKANKKEIDRINRQVKTEAKNASRHIASIKYPKLAHLFKNKNTDGLAEALLIALFGKEKVNELV